MISQVHRNRSLNQEDMIWASQFTPVALSCLESLGLRPTKELREDDYYERFDGVFFEESSGKEKGVEIAVRRINRPPYTPSEHYPSNDFRFANGLHEPERKQRTEASLIVNVFPFISLVGIHVSVCSGDVLRSGLEIEWKAVKNEAGIKEREPFLVVPLTQVCFYIQKENSWSVCEICQERSEKFGLK